jgi:hypothetical protein
VFGKDIEISRAPCTKAGNLSAKSARSLDRYENEQANDPTFSGILERGVLDLIIEVAALVAANKMRANVLVAGRFSGLRLVLKPAKERLGNALLEIDPRILRNYLPPDVFRKVLIPDSQNIQPHTVVE